VWNAAATAVPFRNYAENYHALELLTYTHRAKIDAIYIDPLYNSWARDWTYNNHLSRATTTTGTVSGSPSWSGG
jgi:hypothetical protein